MEEPSTETLSDEHQDATYPTAKWKSKRIGEKKTLETSFPSTQRPAFSFHIK